MTRGSESCWPYRDSNPNLSDVQPLASRYTDCTRNKWEIHTKYIQKTCNKWGIKVSWNVRILLKPVTRSLSEITDYVHLTQENVHGGILWTANDLKISVDRRIMLEKVLKGCGVINLYSSQSSVWLPQGIMYSYSGWNQAICWSFSFGPFSGW
jgi:hypothetical protein